MQVLAHERVLTELDHARLSSLLTRMTAAGLPHGIEETAIELLDSATTVPTRTIDADVVTMRSRIRLASADAREMVLVLAYPPESDAAAGQISVLSPLGLSLIGRRVAQAIRWQGPDQVVHEATLAEILYQPEASGDYGA